MKEEKRRISTSGKRKRDVYRRVERGKRRKKKFKKEKLKKL
jgi:hypothetical protein